MESTSFPPKEILIAELIKRGATMEQVAQLKDSGANTPDEALLALQTGNARFYTGTPQSSHLSANERRAQIMSQTPFAVIVGCADSRVPMEIIFDQGPGEIFSIRIVGHVMSGTVMGSIEYALRHLKVHLVVVLGHEGCGAVTAAIGGKEALQSEPEHLRSELEMIIPAVDDLANIKDYKARMREAVVSNVFYQKNILMQNPVVQESVAKKQVKVVGAYYEIGSGAVDFLGE